MKRKYTIHYDRFKRADSEVKKVYDTQFGSLISGAESILEIGCGDGQFLQYCSNLGVQNLVGLELDEDLAKRARTNLKNRAKIITGDAVSIMNVIKKNSKHKYDVIVMIDLLEHIPKNKLGLFLRNCHKVLVQHGSLIIRTPNAESPIFGSYYRYIDLTHTCSFTRHSITYLLKRERFSFVSVCPAKLYISARTAPIHIMRKMVELFYKLLFLIYLGEDGLNMIMTPNLIVEAKK